MPSNKWNAMAKSDFLKSVARTAGAVRSSKKKTKAAADERPRSRSRADSNTLVAVVDMRLHADDAAAAPQALIDRLMVKKAKARSLSSAAARRAEVLEAKATKARRMVERVADAAKKRLASQEALATKAAAGAAAADLATSRRQSSLDAKVATASAQRSRALAAAGRRAVAAAPATLAISVDEDGAAHIDVGANPKYAGFAHQPSAGGGLLGAALNEASVGRDAAESLVVMEVPRERLHQSPPPHLHLPLHLHPPPTLPPHLPLPPRQGTLSKKAHAFPWNWKSRKFVLAPGGRLEYSEVQRDGSAVLKGTMVVDEVKPRA